VFHQRTTCLWLLAACLSSTGAPEYAVMGKGAHFRHLEACFHYPEVAGFSMDPSQVHSAHRFASIRFVGSGPKKCSFKRPRSCPWHFIYPLAPRSRSGLVASLILEDTPKSWLYIGSSIYFQLVKGLHLLCAGKDTPCLIECLT
jgi:hypothetical protein